jgi:hypothetical protein
MTYIVQRKDRFYVVAYDGLDPLTGRERRRWHPVGRDRHAAEAIAATIDRERTGFPSPTEPGLGGDHPPQPPPEPGAPRSWPPS